MTLKFSASAHKRRAGISFEQYLAGLKALFVSQGFDAATATTKALGLAYQSVVAQANALSFKNSFWGMSLMVLCLVPLPFIMRRPKPGQGRPQAAH